MIYFKNNAGKYLRWILLGFGCLIAVVSWQNLSAANEAPALQQLWQHLQSSVYLKTLKTHMPVMTSSMEDAKDLPLVREYILSKVMDMLPVYDYVTTLQEYDTEVESKFSYEMILADEAADENYIDDQTGEVVLKESNPEEEQTQAASGIVKHENPAVASRYAPVSPVSLDKLTDFDYLIQNYYQIDRITTINSGQLNASELLAKDMTLKGGNDKPQLLIYHTHSQERYKDSQPGDPATSIVGVGEYLTKLLQDNYGLNVIHHTGEYDVKDRDSAYSYAGPEIERILAENPSIEVVLDLHRDGVAETMHLVSEINGKQTAQVMFFNGLSRTTKNGDIAYLRNPFLQDNLAFSLQMKIAAEEYYPTLTRPIYLKGYRYNLHYCPKSILVEVGAQTNSFDEAINAMEPLADLLHKVLTAPES